MEGCLRNLPAPILKVTVPQMFSVSAVASSDACLLKSLIHTSSYEGALLQGPQAVLGKIAHELVDRAIRGLRCEGEQIFHELDRMLKDLMEDARKRLERNPETAPYADLSTTMSRLAWARKHRKILDLAYESAGRARQFGCSSHALGNGTFRFKNMRRDGRWIEIPIEVPELRLKGRMDVLERRGGEIKITDIKSGRVEERNGEIDTRILRQIRLYGLMAKTVMPSMNVTLAVNDGVELPIPFDADIQNDTLSWLSSITASLPPGSTVACEKLSMLGPDCKTCDMRHRCGRYLREAPILWTGEADWTLPLDVWGTVERLDSNVDDLCDMTLIDAGGRRIKVFRLQRYRVRHVRTGDRIWLFNLLASVLGFRNNSTIHPLNFYEVGDTKTDRAWSISVFSEITNL